MPNMYLYNTFQRDITPVTVRESDGLLLAAPMTGDTNEEHSFFGGNIIDIYGALCHIAVDGELAGLVLYPTLKGVAERQAADYAGLGDRKPQPSVIKPNAIGFVTAELMADTFVRKQAKGIAMVLIPNELVADTKPFQCISDAGSCGVDVQEENYNGYDKDICGDMRLLTNIMCALGFNAEANALCMENKPVMLTAPNGLNPTTVNMLKYRASGIVATYIVYTPGA